MLKAFILAAGEASRFAPYSRLLEKSMLPLGGKPVVRIIAERLYRQFAFNEHEMFICVLEKHVDVFKHEFRDMKVGLKAFAEPLGTVNTLVYASQKEGITAEDDILLHYADTYTDINYADMYNRFRECGKGAMIAISRNIKHDYSEVHFDTGSGMVVKMVEKPLLHYPTWTGIAIFNHGAWFYLMGGKSAHDCIDFGYDIFPTWAEQQGLAGYMVDVPYYDVGNPSGYTKLRDSLGKAR